ncbi:expressed unknown protein [Seminavis robusta]|uniref:Uncharacterized protein n=1 Tax=Seminavis robusta TaxID=568900 RepID=A0A9N8H912_9STRA|nr:expressed unknown protein [Seminavis robusta]|eukprot:Sro104_g053010.1 n/a (281) ;mRNA; f:106235-107077
MSSSSSSTVLIAGSALLMAAAAFSLIPASSSKTGGIDEIDEDPAEDYITEQDVCKIFDRLFMEMQAVLGQLGQQIQQLQMAGQQIPEAQLRQLLRGEFERALTAKQTAVFEDNDVDEDCLEEATWEFLDQPEKYPEAKKSIERFQKLWENVSGESVIGKRPGKPDEVSNESFEILPPEKLIEIAEVYFGALSEAMRGLVNKYKEEGKDLSSPAVAQRLQMEFSATANDSGGEALNGLGCSMQQFQMSIEAHAAKPEVGRALATLQMKQQQELMSMGLATM